MKKIGLFFGLLLLLASCSQDQLSPSSSDVGESVVRVSLHTSPMSDASPVKSRSTVVPTDASSLEDAIKHVWAFQFQNGALYSVTGGPVNDVYDIDLTFKDNTGGYTSKIYIIANMKNAYVAGTNFPIGMTEAAFKGEISAAITSESAFLSQSGEATGSYMPMCGVSGAITVSNNGSLSSVLTINLVRMLARVDVVCSLASGTDFKLQGVRVCNVPTKMKYYRDWTSAPVYSGTEPAITNAATDLFNTDCEAITTPKTLIFYLPENHRGTATNTLGEKYKTGIANATYFEFTGLSGGKTVLYNIYPGYNNTGDYNLDRNTKYTLNATFDSGSSTDPRATILPHSNCYMVAPSGGTVKIPIARANEGPNPNAIDNVAAPSTPGYTVSILWQTVNAANFITLGNPTCQGGYFTVTAPSATPGNALVVIRKTGTNDILWSWHIWVTTGTVLTELNPNGNKIPFMDRNLGAINTTNTDVGSFGMYYQWGRKDPLAGPAATSGTAFQSLYTVSGSTVSPYTIPAVVTGPVAIATTIANPAAFCTGLTGVNDWNNTPNDNLWSSSKTVYDPCPVGWRVPTFIGGTVSPWLGFSRPDNSIATWPGSKVYPYSGYRSNGMGSFNSLGGQGRYWSGSVAGTKVYTLFFNSTTVFPSNDNDVRAMGIAVRCVQE